MYRVDPRLVGELLPKTLSPRLRSGHAIASVCYTRLGPALFRRRSEGESGSDHLAYRLAVERADGSPATWIARRETSSWLEARCGGKLLGGEYGRSRFRVQESAFGLELSVDGERGEAFYLRGEVAAEARGSLFPNAQALGGFLDESRPVRPYDVFAPEADELDLAEHFCPEPLCVFEARTSFLSEPPFGPGAAELDSAWRIVSRRMLPVPARRPTFRVVPGAASQVAPT